MKLCVEPEELSITTLEKFLNENNIKSNEESASTNLSKVLKTKEKLKEFKSKTINFSKPIITQNGLPVIFPKTINVIQGKKGQHKTRLAEFMCSILLKKSDYTKEILNLKACQNKDYTVCFVDTERNITEQFPYSLQQIQLRAGYKIEEHPENFEYITLLEIERKDRFETLRQYIEHIREQHKNHLFIVLDVLTDCVENFNDPRNSLELIDLMNKTINEFDVTFLCVIHENPNSEKARGHLGTEIINKASTVIQVAYERDANQKETDIIKILYLHCRTTKKHEPFYIKYSESEKGLVLAEQREITETWIKEPKSSIIEVSEYLATRLTEPVERQKI